MSIRIQNLNLTKAFVLLKDFETVCNCKVKESGLGMSILCFKMISECCLK